MIAEVPIRIPAGFQFQLWPSSYFPSSHLHVILCWCSPTPWLVFLTVSSHLTRTNSVVGSWCCDYTCLLSGMSRWDVGLSILPGSGLVALSDIKLKVRIHNLPVMPTRICRGQWGLTLWTQWHSRILQRSGPGNRNGKNFLVFTSGFLQIPFFQWQFLFMTS